MLRDPERPGVDWQGAEGKTAKNPSRPFFADGKTVGQQRQNAEQRCQEVGRKAVEHPDVTGGRYFTCEEDDD